MPCLEAIVSAGHEVVGVVTQPDKPSGRGMQLSASPVKKAAERLGLSVLQPRRVRAESFVATATDLQPELIAVAAFGQIIPQSILDLPKYGPINVHGSILPKYRGAAPIQRAIMDGETVTGVTTMWMDATLDTGDMLLIEETPILLEDTTGTLFERLSGIGARLLIETINGLRAGTIERKPQNSDAATYAAMIKPEDCLLSWSMPAAQIRSRIQGLLPKPGAFTVFQGKRLKLHSTAVSEVQTDAAPGTVVTVSRNLAGLVVAAGQGTSLLLLQVQPDNGKRMSADAWANGLRVKPGDKFDADAQI